MQWNEYKEGALSTESVIEKVVANKTELTYVLGAFITITEMLDCLKKKIYYGKDKKYNEQFHALAEQLSFFTTCSDRHHDIAESVDIPVNPRVFHALLGIMTEAGELGSALLKGVNGEEIDATNLGEEGGDVMWYMAILCDALGIDFETGMLLVNNIKLTKVRYKNGFTSQEADVRNLEAERQVLEGKHGEA